MKLKLAILTILSLSLLGCSKRQFAAVCDGKVYKIEAYGYRMGSGGCVDFDQADHQSTLCSCNVVLALDPPKPEEKK